MHIGESVMFAEAQFLLISWVSRVQTSLKNYETENLIHNRYYTKL